MVDVVQYLFALVLLWSFSDMKKEFLELLFVLLAWRAVGVGMFTAFEDTRFLIPFLDGIKELLLLWWFCNGDVRGIYVIVVCVCKIIFEYRKNWGATSIQ